VTDTATAPDRKPCLSLTAWPYGAAPAAGVIRIHGPPDVLATGYLVAIIEWACIHAVNEHLDDGEQTLGVHVDPSHEAQTVPGDTLTVTTELARVTGRQLTFTVTAADDAGTVCQGTHQRAIIDCTRFEDRLAARKTDQARWISIGS
jgi:fluoroacetyl-CoA thioesterase